MTERELQLDTPAMTQEERNWAVLTHVGSLVLWVVPALVVYLVSESERVRAHALEDLNLVLAYTVYGVVLVALTIATVGIGGLITVPLMVVLGLLYIVMLIIAAAKASGGELFRYKLVFRLLQ
jgi:uncharacterized Tic20 family protein